jgi:hypothetical protein
MAKGNLERNITTQEVIGKSKLKIFFNQQLIKIKKRQFTCPLCREVFQGISAFGAHLKKHCT